MGEGTASEMAASAGLPRRWADRNQFKVYQDPQLKDRMSKPSMPAGTLGLSDIEDDETRMVAETILGLSDARERLAWTLRDSLDETLDGGRTGRWAYQHLKKTEKTALGTAVEINLQNEFGFPDGDLIDWKIGGVEVDCKFSKDYGKWQIPMEMYRCADHGEQTGATDHLALLVWLNDDESQWAAGLVRITDQRLRFKQAAPTERAYNRDNKRTLSAEGLGAVHWLWGGRQGDLPENVILHLDPAARDRVFAAQSRAGPNRAGQQRVNQLFREVQGQIVTRRTVQTVAQQDDPMKRARDARLHKHLGKEGIMVLGHQQADPYIAAALGLPIPRKGEFVSVAVTPCGGPDEYPRIHLDGVWWRATAAADPPGVMASAPRPDRTGVPGRGWSASLQ